MLSVRIKGYKFLCKLASGRYLINGGQWCSTGGNIWTKQPQHYFLLSGTGLWGIPCNVTSHSFTRQEAPCWMLGVKFWGRTGFSVKPPSQDWAGMSKACDKGGVWARLWGRGESRVNSRKGEGTSGKWWIPGDKEMTLWWGIGKILKWPQRRASAQEKRTWGMSQHMWRALRTQLGT